MTNRSNDKDRYFFIHIMKVAGGSFNAMLRRSFAPEERYPDADYDQDLIQAKLDVDYFKSLPPARREKLRYFAPHFPFVASDLITPTPIRLAFFRDPVDRVVSQIKQERRHRAPSLSLAEVFHNWPEADGRLSNHQTQVMGAKNLDEFPCIVNKLEVGREHLERAKQNVEGLDFIGINENFEESVLAFERRFNLNLGDSLFRNVGDNSDVGDSVKSSIREQNQLDIELYEHVKKVFALRRSEILK